MTHKKGRGSATAQKANARPPGEGSKNLRDSSAAQADLGRRSGKAAAKKKS